MANRRRACRAMPTVGAVYFRQHRYEWSGLWRDGMDRATRYRATELRIVLDRLAERGNAAH